MVCSPYRRGGQQVGAKRLSRSRHCLSACRSGTHKVQGGVMPTIIVTHDVTDTDHWLSSPKREEVLPSLGASNIRTFVNTQDRTKFGLVMEIADLDVFFAALKNP